MYRCSQRRKQISRHTSKHHGQGDQEGLLLDGVVDEALPVGEVRAGYPQRVEGVTVDDVTDARVWARAG